MSKPSKEFYKNRFEELRAIYKSGQYTVSQASSYAQELSELYKEYGNNYPFDMFCYEIKNLGTYFEVAISRMMQEIMSSKATAN